MNETLRDEYLRAQNHRGLAFIDRPYIGSPGGAAQAETNASRIWGHMLGGFLFGYEYTRWWKESHALRGAAILGDWSWLNKVRVTGPDASRFMAFAAVKDLSKQRIGQVIFAPMVNDEGKVVVEGLSLRLAEDEYIYTAGGAETYLANLANETTFDIDVIDVTPDFTCYALQGPKSPDIIRELTGTDFSHLRFSRWEKCKILDTDVIVARQGVTGEVGYEFYMPTSTNRGHDLWRTIREIGTPHGLRELGLKAQLIGHTETGIATSMRDYLPARGSPSLVGDKLVRRWSSSEEYNLMEGMIGEHFCSPAELGWGYTVELDRVPFKGQKALAEEAERGGPVRKFVGLTWDSDDMAELFAGLFRDGPSPPPPDLPYGQMRVTFIPVMQNERQVGWASGYTYSPTLRRMISLARIDRALSEPGTELTVRWGSTFANETTANIRATVQSTPFIKRQRENNLSP
ncbi:glycine cleavage T C-terminal barrel domain-containing protein [Bradyrhizobium sp. ma5]|uniref:glycine cleavage T C-terminal barrel domain-containing protein n=1 Tax=Bradyrhizobium sp. ma5 TaxID=3344828 RepID=UPI0035D4966F